ncbi:MAG: diaminopimelate epimerase, partial [Deltaproteobacteria bacterium]|nr:diaminopimelate epimerase [Deltaproteobacteria bacterium]
RLENHPLFPQRTNVALARPLGPSAFEVVVWERGCGITQACGTGACATAVAACLVGLANEERWLSITLPGGSLQVMVKADLSEVYLRGPARYVFRGGLSLG